MYDDFNNGNYNQYNTSGYAPPDGGYRAKPPRKKSNFGKYLALVLITTILSSAIAGGGMYLYFTGKLAETASAQAAAAVSSAMQNAISSDEKSGASASPTVKPAVVSTNTSSVTEIAKKAGPSIVGIRMTLGNPRQSFGRQNAQEAEGSGIIISADGYIMTNYHVVSYADPKGGYSGNTTLEVFLPDKRQAKATFIGGDSTNDLAVVKIDLTGLPAAELGDSSQLEVGEEVIAIGNPLGMEFAGSVTTGVVSALNRQIETEVASMDLIQTDAAINPGNSGGALVNLQGQVIGINSSKISATGVEGLGFAIPINTAKPIVEQLKSYGYVKGRPLIGISGQEITEAISQQYGLPMGIYITQVTPDSGAAAAGIQEADILLSLDGQDIKTMTDVNTVKNKHTAGDTVKAVVYRQGNKMDITITFSEEK